MEIITIAILSLLCIGLALACLRLQSRSSHNAAECARLSERNAILQNYADIATSLQSENSELSRDKARLESANEALSAEAARVEPLQKELTLQRENLAAIKAANEALNADLRRLSEDKSAEEERRLQQFELLARRVLSSQSENLQKDSKQALDGLLTPLKEEINRFRDKIEKYYTDENAGRVSLSKEIMRLVEANTSIGRKAEELSSALRGNSKIQGDWGEMVLETILDKSGLRRGEEYEVQQTVDETGRTLRDSEGRGLRPDVVVHYPGRGCMVIDSKVSLTAYTDMVNADTDDERKAAEKRHLMSVQKHIAELSAKRYEEYVGKEGHLDFVMMFIPNEGAYAAALQLDPKLWETAYDKRVLLVSPTQLVGSLRLVAQLWRHNRQTQNAIEIARKSGDLYDKFVNFIADLDKVEKQINGAQTALSEARKKLSTGKGNLISRAEKIKALGLRTDKQLSTEGVDDLD